MILFGSQARREANPNSDIDVMTVLEDPIDVTKEVYKTSDIRFYFLDKYGELVSIVPVTKSDFVLSSTSLVRIAKREGIKIWVKSINYSAQALLLSENIETSTHKGVIKLINMHFVRTNQLDRTIFKLLSNAYDLRANT